jgi:hypothetical protein
MNEQLVENIILNLKQQTQLEFKPYGLEGLAVRIENENDEVFWRAILEKALPNKGLVFLPSFKNIKEAYGKYDYKKYLQYADNQLIFCKDADYDYLLQNSDFDKPFVFHTYVYSRENYYCIAEGLTEVVKIATNTEGVTYNPLPFLLDFSKMIYPYLLSSLYATQKADGLLSAEELGKTSGFVKISKPKQELKEKKQDLKTKYEATLLHYNKTLDFKKLKKQVTELGVNSQNAYLFLRGHNVLRNITIPLMKYMGDNVSKKHFKSLKTNTDKAKYQEHINANAYHIVAQNNPYMPQSEFYNRIINDIKQAFSQS